MESNDYATWLWNRVDRPLFDVGGSRVCTYGIKLLNDTCFVCTNKGTYLFLVSNDGSYDKSVYATRDIIQGQLTFYITDDRVDISNNIGILLADSFQILATLLAPILEPIQPFRN